MSNNSHSTFTFSGFIQGAISWLFWMPLVIGIIIGFSTLFGVAISEDATLFVSATILVVPVLLAIWTGRLISDYQRGLLSDEVSIKFIKARKTLITFFVSFIIMLMLAEGSNLNDSEALTMFVGIPALITILIVFLGPAMYKGLLNIMGNRSSSGSGHTGNRNSSGSWFKDKIVAPVIVGIILGVITFMITGEYSAGGGVSLLSMPITLILGR